MEQTKEKAVRIIEKFELWVDYLHDRRGHLLKGRIMADNKVIFFLPFEPTIQDFYNVLHSFRSRFSVTDSCNFEIKY